MHKAECKDIAELFIKIYFYVKMLKFIINVLQTLIVVHFFHITTKELLVNKKDINLYCTNIKLQYADIMNIA